MPPTVTKLRVFDIQNPWIDFLKINFRRAKPQDTNSIPAWNRLQVWV
jgi:hypothetical protein